MPEIDFAEKQRIIAKLNLMNNKFMNKTFDGDIICAQLLLRIILDNDKIKVKQVAVQRLLQNLYGHSAQLDILAEDEAGRKFNVEVQRSDEGAQAKRARFYSSVLDTHFLEAGKEYKELDDVYVIFITENDVMNYGLPIYNIQRYIDENGKAFADGSHIIYVNSKIQDDTPLGRLMHDFYCADPDKMYYKELSVKVKSIKENKEEENTMRDLIEEYADKRAKKAAYQKTVEFAKGLLADGMSIDFTVRHTDLPLEEVQKLAEKRSA